MKKTTLTLVPALGLSLTLALGCSEEADTNQEVTDALNAAADELDDAGTELKDAGGEMKDSIKEQAESAVDGVKDQAAAQADQVKDQVAEKTDEIKQQATDMVAELKDKATEMIDQIQTMIEEKKFGDAEAMLTKLKEMPGFDKLGPEIEKQVANLQNLIEQGKGMAEKAQGLMGK